MKDFDQPLVGTKLSLINSAAFINIRLNELWNDCHKHSRAGFYLKWNDDLDRVWCELVGDIKKDDEEEKDFKKLNEEVSGTAPKQFKKGFEDIEDTIKIEIATHRQALINKEVFLRRLMHKQGKGTAYKNPTDDDMD